MLKARPTDPKNYAQTMRLAFIDYRMVTHGRVCRRDIAKKFGVHMGQATEDLALFDATYPSLIRYDNSARRYVWARGIDEEAAQPRTLIARRLLEHVPDPLDWLT